MFIAKMLMYGVLSLVMGFFCVGMMSDFIAWISIFGCVIVIDVLAMMDMGNSVPKLNRKNME